MEIEREAAACLTGVRRSSRDIGATVLLWLALCFGCSSTYRSTSTSSPAREDAYAAAQRRCEDVPWGSARREAIDSCQELVSMALSLFGQRDARTAAALASLAERHSQQGHSVQAVTLMNQAMRAWEASGANRAVINAGQARLHQLHYVHALRACAAASKGARYAEAALTCQQAVNLTRTLYGNKHVRTAEALADLALPLSESGKTEEAVPLMAQALSIWSAALGPENRVVVNGHVQIGDIYAQGGQASEAEREYLRALSISEAISDTEGSSPAIYIHWRLGRFYEAQAQSHKAEPALRRALEIAEREFGTMHRDVAALLIDLAAYYLRLGLDLQAESLLRRALLILEKLSAKESATPEQQQIMLTALENLSLCLRRRGALAESDALAATSARLQEALEARDSRILAQNLFRTALKYFQNDQLESAERLLERVQSIREAIYGPEHLEVARCLALRGDVFSQQGRFDAAADAYHRVLAIRTRSLGAEHPLVGDTLLDQALLAVERDDVELAIPKLRHCLQISESRLRGAVSEPRIAALLSGLRYQYQESATYALLLRPEVDPRVRALAMTLSLLRKGRAAEAGRHTSVAIFNQLEPGKQRELFATWQKLREERERLLFEASAVPAQSMRQKIDALTLRIESIEHTLATSAPLLRQQEPPQWSEVIPQVASQLPPGSALVDVVWSFASSFRRRSSDAWSKGHYVAMVLYPDRRVESVDLGRVGEIDQDVVTLLSRLRDSMSNVPPAAQALYHRLWKPLEPLLVGVGRLYLSLDGSLNLLPFAALHDGQRYLIDRYEFHYLTSGRDLLRNAKSHPSNPSLVLADPDLGVPSVLTATEPASTIESTRNLYTQLKELRPLPATRTEAQLLERLLPSAVVRLGARASEAELRQAHAPQILHIATHGIFVDQERERVLAAAVARPGVRGFKPLSTSGLTEAGVESVLGFGITNPLSRSALVLAGAARGGSPLSAAEDGLMTAEEVRSLNLWGTELVVLSACESGRGAVRRGEGVYGLRRSFLIAGAETLVTSLWRVADEETSELMTLYYEKLVRERRPRIAALRESMQELRKRRPHPYYWAPFIAIGKDAPLSR